ncbi:MAG: peptidase domain-containing ABC transporter [Sediminibacterium sp.]|nr:peptidase domain-containing ABC transporter [Sediminibacterium sp.]
MFRFPNYIQHEEKDCGPTCLKIITEFYGKKYPLNLLKELCNTSRLGSSFKDLSNGAENIGFRTLPVKVTLKKIYEEKPFPFIAHWKQNHFVVVYKMNRHYVWVSDPANGLLKYTRKDFIKFWISREADENSEEGIALLLEPTITFFDKETPKDKSDNNRELNRFIRIYFLPHKKVMLQILITLVLGAFMQLFVPFLTQNIVDVGINTKNISFIWILLLGQLMLTIGNLTLEWYRSWALLLISNKMNLSLISDFFVKLMRLPLRFFDSRLSGDLMQRIQDHSRIQSFLTNGSITIIFSVFSFLLYGSILCYYSFKLFLIFLTGSTFYVIWILFFLKRRAKLDYMRFQDSGQTTSKVIELIGSMQEIKLNNAEQQKRWSWERVQIRLYKTAIKSLAIEQIQVNGSGIINELKNIFIIIFSSTLVINGEITLGTMLSINYIIGQLNAPVVQFVGIIKNWQDAKLSLNRLMEIHSKEEENYQASIPVPSNHTIAFKDVSYKYHPNDSFGLKHLNCSIPFKKVTAIVGASGSGKTTLLKMLMQFYKPNTGQIEIDGINLSELNLKEWRTKCGVVLQEGQIFNDTIAKNIALGEDLPDMEKVINCAKLANIHEYIVSIPMSYGTNVGQEGMGLSTGQKQRILIARALYKNPEILFFDEATSALDAKNEQEIVEKLHHFFVGKTVVIIAHRLSTVINADNIIVMDNGEIVEEGKHTELVELKGRYYNLIKKQLELGN